MLKGSFQIRGKSSLNSPPWSVAASRAAAAAGPKCPAARLVGTAPDSAEFRDIGGGGTSGEANILWGVRRPGVGWW